MLSICLHENLYSIHLIVLQQLVGTVRGIDPLNPAAAIIRYEEVQPGAYVLHTYDNDLIGDLYLLTAYTLFFSMQVILCFVWFQMGTMQVR